MTGWSGLEQAGMWGRQPGCWGWADCCICSKAPGRPARGRRQAPQQPWLGLPPLCLNPSPFPTRPPAHNKLPHLLPHLHNKLQLTTNSLHPVGARWHVLQVALGTGSQGGACVGDACPLHLLVGKALQLIPGQVAGAGSLQRGAGGGILSVGTGGRPAPLQRAGAAAASCGCWAASGASLAGVSLFVHILGSEE